MNLDKEILDKKWEEVRRAELAEIAMRREKAELTGANAGNAEAAKQEAATSLIGLALSGGGIRSASFNLGVLQALVASGLFRYVDYLSTVSGGGYIGSFISSLAYRQHVRRSLTKDTAAAATKYEPPPIAPKNDGSQPDDTKSLAKNSNFLNDKLEALSRYLIGWFMNFITLFSGLVFASSVVALAWRFLDMPFVVDFLYLYSMGWILEWNRPFLPAIFMFGLWVLSWLWSSFWKGSTATARHSGKLLVVAAAFFLIGLAIWFGTPNMNFSSSGPSGDNPTFWNAHQQWLVPVATFWLATLLPFLNPRELMKSGTDTKSMWKGWVFQIAGYGVIVGIPFMTVWFIGRHNVSLVADGWDRNLVASDIVDWEKFWKQMKVNKDPVLLRMYEVGGYQNKLFKYIDEEAELYRLQRPNLASLTDQTIGQYYTDIHAKNQVVQIMDRAMGKASEKSTDKATDKGPDYDPFESLLVGETLEAETGALVNQLPAVCGDLRELQRKGQFKQLQFNRGDLVMEQSDPFELLDALRDVSEKAAVRTAKNRAALDAKLVDLPKSILELSAVDNVELFQKKFDLLETLQNLRKTAKDRLEKQPAAQADKDQLIVLEKSIAVLEGDPKLAGAQNNVVELVLKDRRDAKQYARVPDIVSKIQDLNVYYLYLRDVRRKIKAVLQDTAPSDPYAASEAKELQEMLNRYRFYYNSDYPVESPTLKKEARTQRITDEINKHTANHLMLRLFYPTHLRPIQLINRPIVIMPDQYVRLWIMLISGATFLVLGLAVNFNWTSMHGFYRRRIQRTFLVRHAMTDDDREHREIELKAMANTLQGYPYHILSGCVELVTEDRDAPPTMTAFQFSKLYCGGSELDFCETRAFREGKMTLSSSAAICGAALSPTRIQYLLLKVMLTVLNMRLGQWLPNPVKNNSLVLPSRYVPLLRLFASYLSAGGVTRDLSHVFVTDGGHYENLGIDMLLDRRCRLIFASDAGADPTFEYADLANMFAIAARKGIRFVRFNPTDPEFDAEITLESVQVQFQKGNQIVLWKILYPEPDAKPALCVYIKSSLPKPQPFEAGQFKLWNEEFPHDSTANQFFHEQQFEVYRSLGFYLAQNMLKHVKFNAQVQGDKPIDVDRLLESGVFD